MATYSNIGIKLITTGDESGTWGDTTNTNFSDILDEAIAGAVTYNIASDADVTLTVSDGSSSDARHAVINFTSTTLSATRTVTFAPDTLQKTWLVINSTTGGQSLTFKQGSAGATVTVPNGESAIIYSDGAGATNGAITKALDSFTNTKITTGTLNATTLDLTNLEVTNVKAKDGTAALTIADSTGKVTVSSELAVDNLNLSGNAITSTNSNGNIDLTPDGTGEVNITKVDIDAGTIDGTTIATSDITVGAGKTLDVSAGTLTLANDQISGDKIEGGTINAITINTLTSTTVNGTTFDTNVADAGVTLSGVTLSADGTNTNIDINITPKGTGEVNLTKVDIDGGAIDGTAIGVNSASTGAFTTLITSSGSTLNGGVVVNESGADVDFRIESDTNAHAFFVRGSDGYIGIGKNNPSLALDISGGDSAGSRAAFTRTDTSSTLEAGAWFSSGPYVGSATNHPLQIITNDVERMRLDSSGNLGIGVTPSAWSSAFKAFEGGDSNNQSAVAFQTNANALNFYTNAYFDGSSKYKFNGAAGWYQISDNTHAWYTAPSGTAGNAITFTQAMTLDASGNLGVGITSPTSRLHLKGPAGSNPNTNGVVFQNSGTTSNFGAIGLDNSSGDFVVASGSGAALRFYTNSDLATTNERMRITSAGKLLVGGTVDIDTTPFIGLDADLLSVQSTVGGHITLFRNDTSINTGNGFGSIGFYGNDTTSNTPTVHAYLNAVASGTHAAGDNPTDITFGTTPDGTETVAEAGRITQAGSYVLKGGTTTAAAGVGIIFPATQVASANANSLDDYEEGTWTPVLTDGTATHNGTGRYTKVGNNVFVSVRLNNVGSAFSGTVYITGLPFTAGVSPNYALATFINFTSTATTWCARIGFEEASIKIYRTGAASQDNVQLASTDIGQFSDFDISGCYLV